MEKVKKKLLDNNFSNADVLVLLSGGADSVFLLHLLNLYKDEVSIGKIVAVHFNHNLRGKESDDDELFAKNIAKKYNNKFISKKIYPVKYAEEYKLSLEEAARELRYKNIFDIAEDENIKYILLGHNKNDVAETFLMNLFRGSGLNGLTSIKSRTIIDNFILIRPILEIEKSAIFEYLKTNHIKYKTDKSNKSNDYLRNKIRNQIIPHINECLNLDSVKQINAVYYNLLSSNRLISDFIFDKYKKVAKLFRFSNSSVPFIDIIDLADYPEGCSLIEDSYFSKDKLYYFLSYLYRDTIDYCSVNDNKIKMTPVLLNKKNIKDCIRLISNNINGKKIDVSEDYYFVKDYNKIFFLLKKLYKDINISYNYVIDNFSNVNITETGYEIIFESIKTFDYYDRGLLDKDKVKFPLTIRNRKSGDKFNPLYSNICYKLKKYYINKKVSGIFRNVYPIIEDADKNLIFVYPFGVSDSLKCNRNTKNIIRIEVSLW